jgi:formylglycine-generating enzyme required for sulfatase activity
MNLSELITNENYERCYLDSECDIPSVAQDVFHNAANSRNPVIGITWRDAQNYCVWRSGRLPTDVELRAALESQTIAQHSFREWVFSAASDPTNYDTNQEIIAISNGQLMTLMDSSGATWSMPVSSSAPDVSFRCALPAN